jgi:hypothetical protein
MRTLLCATALLSIAFVSAGCKKGNSLEGKWNAQAGTIPIDFEFKADNTFTLGAKVMQYTLSQTGDYKLDGEKLTMTPKDINVSGLPAAALTTIKSQAKLGTAKTVDIKFVSEDEVTLSGAPTPGGSDNQAVTLKRVKA